MGKSFAIGDVHGCAVELRTLLDRLSITPDTRLYFVGDLIDRGENSRLVIETIMHLRSYCHVEVVLGNHEAMFLDFVCSPGTPDAGMFIFNGGSATLASYANEDGDYVIPREHFDFIESLALFHETEKYFMVHAGVPEIPLDQIDPQRHRMDLLWSRAIRRSTHLWEKLIVHGHTQRPEVEVKPNRFNVDAGCVYGGRLAALDLDDHSVHYVRRREAAKKYLSSRSSRRKAVRFDGEIPLRIRRGDRWIDFITSNFNELGMYIRPANPIDEVFEVGDPLGGVILPTDQREIEFSGEVVRVNKEGDAPAYGVRIVLIED